MITSYLFLFLILLLVFTNSFLQLEYLPSVFTDREKVLIATLIRLAVVVILCDLYFY